MLIRTPPSPPKDEIMEIQQGRGLVVVAIGISPGTTASDLHTTLEALARAAAEGIHDNLSRRIHPSPEERERFAITLRRFRIAADVSQQELAERANLSTNTVSALERGARTKPYRVTVEALAKALGLSDGDRTTLETARAAA
jgi:DNA-binding XRE family transcriptional regulator